MCSAEPPATQPAEPSPPAAMSNSSESDLAERLLSPERRRQKLVDYFVRIHGRHLKSEDPYQRSLGLVALSEILAPETTDLLFATMEHDDAPFLRLLAWEALHARHASLTDEQRLRWMQGGVRLARGGHIRGVFRPVLIQAGISYGPNGRIPDLDEVLLDLLKTTRVDRPEDNQTLLSIRMALATWLDFRAASKFVRLLRTPRHAHEAEFVLGGLTNKIAPVGRLDPRTMEKQPATQKQWNAAAAQWTSWLVRAELTPTPVGKLPAYQGRSRYLPPPREIRDPDNPRWRKELELDVLRLDAIDVVFVIDSTGSMGGVLQWIQRDVIRMMKTFRFFSRQPRIGVVFYRDHEDAQYSYTVRSVPLTGDGETLYRAIAGERPFGGGTWEEAVLDGLKVGLTEQKWNARSFAKRVVMLIGDAPPHKKDLPEVKTLVGLYGRNGYVIHTVKVSDIPGAEDDPAMNIFEELAELGGGQCVPISFGASPLAVWDEDEEQEEAMPGLPNLTIQIAPPPNTEAPLGPYRQIVGEIIRGSINKDYRRWVNPTLAMMLEYVRPDQPEEQP